MSKAGLNLNFNIHSVYFCFFLLIPVILKHSSYVLQLKLQTCPCISLSQVNQFEQNICQCWSCRTDRQLSVLSPLCEVSGVCYPPWMESLLDRNAASPVRPHNVCQGRRGKCRDDSFMKKLNMEERGYRERLGELNRSLSHCLRAFRGDRACSILHNLFNLKISRTFTHDFIITLHTLFKVFLQCNLKTCTCLEVPLELKMIKCSYSMCQQRAQSYLQPLLKTKLRDNDMETLACCIMWLSYFS